MGSGSRRLCLEVAAGSLKPVDYIAHRTRWVCAKGAFPDDPHPPSRRLQLFTVLPISLHIARELLLPEIRVAGWVCAEPAAIMPMPEAAMNEYHRAEPGKNQIRPAGQMSRVESVAITGSMQPAA